MLEFVISLSFSQELRWNPRFKIYHSRQHYVTIDAGKSQFSATSGKKQQQNFHWFSSFSANEELSLSWGLDFVLFRRAKSLSTFGSSDKRCQNNRVVQTSSSDIQLEIDSKANCSQSTCRKSTNQGINRWINCQAMIGLREIFDWNFVTNLFLRWIWNFMYLLERFR